MKSVFFKNIVLFIIFFVAFGTHLVKSQHFNNIPTYNKVIDFNSDPVDSINMAFPDEYYSHILSDKSGVPELFIYLYGQLLLTNKKDTVYSPTSLSIIGENGPQTGLNHILITLPFLNSPNMYHFFIIEKSSTPCDSVLYYFVADNSSDHLRLELIDTFKFDNAVLSLSAGYYEADNTYWLVAIDGNSDFTSFKIKSDTIVSRVYSELKDVSFEIDSPFHLKDAYMHRVQLLISPKLHYLFNTYYFPYEGNIFCGSNMFHFDPHTGKVSFYRKVTTKQEYVWHIQGMAFSPNDSFLYFDLPATYDKYLVQYDLNNNSCDTFFNLDCGFIDFFLANNGKIYISNCGKMMIINNPDLKYPKCNLSIEKVILYAWFPFTLYENLRTDILFNNSCGLKPNFNVLCDTNKYKNFSWHCNNDSVVGKNVYFDLPKSGEYIIILKAKTDYGYIRHHTDTFIFLKPPTANFTTDTTIGCQWLKFKFYDASIKDTVNAALGESWLWHFGDGGTSTQQNPEHIYTQTGKYKVKLIYSNGFCTDTIEKEQAVEIIEAPRPGFAMSQTNYCSPYTLQITDTSLGRVQTWHYDFGDGNSDSTASPSHRYPNAGTYKIVQTLTGPTGCVTKDSALLHLRPGFEGSEEINSLTTMVVNNNSILLNWQKHEDAFSYDLFRSSNDTNYPKLLNLTDSFFLDDKLIRDDQVYAYKIKGIDSCSRPSDFSRKLKNIVLTGEAHKSEYSILRWTPFELWQQGVKEYVLEYVNANGEFVQLLSTSQREVKDEQFFTDDRQHEKCYRVLAIEQQGNQQQSISNTLCLPYEATFFIPTAFSPNGDGLNDTFFVKGISIESIHIRIYNRWGQLIFQTTDLYEGWDGTYKGKACPIDAYSCVITGRRKDKKYISHSFTISLIR